MILHYTHQPIFGDVLFRFSSYSISRIKSNISNVFCNRRSDIWSVKRTLCPRLLICETYTSPQSTDLWNVHFAPEYRLRDSSAISCSFFRAIFCIAWVVLFLFIYFMVSITVSEYYQFITFTWDVAAKNFWKIKCDLQPCSEILVIWFVLVFRTVVLSWHDDSAFVIKLLMLNNILNSKHHSIMIRVR